MARQTDTTLVAAPALLANKMAPAVSGRLTLRQAIDKLLAGSGLIGRVDDGVLTVQLAPPPAKAITPPGRTDASDTAPTREHALDPVTVSASSAATAARALRESAQAVTVVETDEAKTQTADLGEVLTRVQGVGVRRSGGLGSDTRFSINGLTDEHIRFFLDGIPLDMAGYPFGIADVPVNLIDQVEIYRGVVPMRFGADALGGAVNLVTDQHFTGTRASASYQIGSFGTQRITAGFRHLHEPTGLFMRLNAFHDRADNDYKVDVEVPDARGRLSPARVRRFHDHYAAQGTNLEVGLVRRPWAERLLLRVFATERDKDIQHNLIMTVPYGEARSSQTSRGASLRYVNSFAENLSLDVVAGLSRNRTHFLDATRCIYNWSGVCVGQRAVAGEISTPSDRLLWDHSHFVRANFGWTLAPGRDLKLSLAPTWTSRTGDERIQANPLARDLLSARREMLMMVSGLEFVSNHFDERLENILFVKHYLQNIESDVPSYDGGFRRSERKSDSFGFGNALRYRLSRSFYAKASYERATRLPRSDEVFGDGMQILDNPELKPEASQNLNLGIAMTGLKTRAGVWRGELNAFARQVDDMILMLGSDRFFRYYNLYAARSTGVEGALGWVSPSGFLSLDGSLTWMNFRNSSREGVFGTFRGDRIPNRPYLFGHLSTSLNWHSLWQGADVLRLSWNTRYVHEFYRGWESVGSVETRPKIPSQLVHSLAMIYELPTEQSQLTFAVEMHNLSDRRVYDNYGIQRPGRGLYFKVTSSL